LVTGTLPVPWANNSPDLRGAYSCESVWRDQSSKESQPVCQTVMEKVLPGSHWWICLSLQKIFLQISWVR